MSFKRAVYKQVVTLRRWRSHWRAYDASEPDASHFRAQQMQAVLRLTPLAMSIQLACAVVVPLALWGQVARGLLLLWSAVISVLALISFRAWFRHRLGSFRPSASSRALQRITWHGALLGGAWGLLPVITAGRLVQESRYLIGMLVTGMICAGGFALAAVPEAGTVFVLLVGTGAAVELLLRGGSLSPAMLLQVVGYSAIVIYTVWLSARMMGARMLAEAKAAHQSEVISLLLRDFQNQTSDFLWELNSHSQFVEVSPRLLDALGLSADQLQAKNALRLVRELVPSDREARGQWRDFQRCLDRRRPFRDQTLALQTSAGVQWWSLSASPLFGRNGGHSGWRGVATNITERHQALQKLSWLAHNDPLTGLVNRTRVRALLRELLSGDPVAAQPLALLVLDLDGFKQINDSRGHAAGDHMLREFGRRLRSMMRPSDIAARLGGDEFALIVRDVIAPSQLQPFLEELLETLAEPCWFEGQLTSLQGSIGVALAPADGVSADTLMNHADVALYSAKHDGGHRYCFFDKALADAGRRRVAMARALRGATERGELYLLYQPQVNAQSGGIEGMEALIRWRHPDFGEVSPVDFIPIAEGAGLMPQIGDWVLAEACHTAAAWPGKLRISINVSAKQLSDPGFTVRVAQAADGLSPGQVELEITESALIDDPEAAVTTLHALRTSGLRTALDDFGTGYSALGYLRRFPFDTLKIDRSFVCDLARDGEAQIIVDTILAMARALRMSTVAEGVESLVEAHMLRDRGCSTLQGYLISRPLPADQVASFIQDWRMSSLEVG